MYFCCSNTTSFMQIEYLVHSSIDKEKWDQAILNADNGLLYACSWYLDCVSPGWEAIVANDYEYVFPVPVKRKYKLPYIVQPFLAQQLGLFGKGECSENMLHDCLSKLPSYSYEINLNYANFLDDAQLMTNLILPLDKSYTTIRKNYSTNTLRNIRKAEKNAYTFREVSVNDFLMAYNSVEHPDSSVSLELIEQVITKGYEQSNIRCCALLNSTDQPVSGLAYGWFKNRIIYLFPFSTAEGKAGSAMFLLVDELLRQHAGSDLIFDFEGSMIEGVARFYKGYGAQPEIYRIARRLRPSFLVGKI